MNSATSDLSEIQLKALCIFSKYQNRTLLDEVYNSTGSCSVPSILELLLDESQQLNIPTSLRATQFIIDIIQREILRNPPDYPKKDIINILQALNIKYQINTYDIHKKLSSQSCPVPLKLIYTLWQTGIISTVLYLQHCVEVKTKANSFVKELVAIILQNSSVEDCKLISHFLSIMIQIAYSSDFPELPEMSASIQKSLAKTTEIMLETVTRKLWDVLLAQPEIMVEVYSFVPRYQSTYMPNIKLSAAITSQHQWTVGKFPSNLTNFLQEVMFPLECEKILQEIDSVLSNSEINWKTLLFIISAINVFYVEGNRLIKDLVNTLLQTSFDQLRTDLSVAAILIIRQVTMDADFSSFSYGQWFSITFGSSTSVANTENTFTFLVKLMSSMVPYETASALKAHISNTPFIPQGERCRSLWRDYSTLAKARLNDLTPPTEENSAPEVSSEQSSRTELDIQTHIAHFERTGHLPNTVLETAIFKRSYFTRTYLPLLLKPRLLPENPDSRLRFIESLRNCGKLSAAAYEEFRQKCVSYAESMIGGVLTDDVMEWVESDPLEQLKELMKKLEDDWLLRNEKPGNLVFAQMKSCFKGLIPDQGIVTEEIDLEEELRKETRVKDNVSFKVLQTLLATLTKCTIPYGRNGPPQWIHQFVLVLLDSRRIIRALYYELWDRIHSFELENSLMQSYGVILSLIHRDRNLFPLAKYRSRKEFLPIVLLKNLPVVNSGSQEFLVKMLHAVIRPGCKGIVLEQIPDPDIVKLYLWISRRLQFLSMKDSFVDYLAFADCEEFKKPEFQISLDEFLQLEMSININDDIFHWSERLPYFSSILESQQYFKFLSNRAFQDIQGDTISLHILHFLLKHTWSAKDKHPNCLQDLLMFLQSRLLLPETSASSRSPWLLTYWTCLHRGNFPEVPRVSSLDHTLWNLIKSLPAYLLSRNSPTGTAQIEPLNELIEQSWRNSMTTGAWLPRFVVQHVIQAVDIKLTAPCLKFSAAVFGIPITSADLEWKDLTQSLAIFNPHLMVYSCDGKISWTSQSNIDLRIGQLIIIAFYVHFLKKTSLDSPPWYVRHLCENVRNNPNLLNCWDLDAWTEDQQLPWMKIMPDSFFVLLTILNLNTLVNFEYCLNQKQDQSIRYLELLLKAHSYWVVNLKKVNFDEGPLDVDYPSGKILDLITLAKLTANVKRILSTSAVEILKKLRISPIFASADEDFKRLVDRKCI